MLRKLTSLAHEQERRHVLARVTIWLVAAMLMCFEHDYLASSRGVAWAQASAVPNKKSVPQKNSPMKPGKAKPSGRSPANPRDKLVRGQFQEQEQKYLNDLRQRIDTFIGARIPASDYVLEVSIKSSFSSYLKQTRTDNQTPDGSDDADLDLVAMPEDTFEESVFSARLERLRFTDFSSFVRRIDVAITLDNDVAANMAKVLQDGIKSLLPKRLQKGSKIETKTSELSATTIRNRLQETEADADKTRRENQELKARIGQMQTEIGAASEASNTASLTAQTAQAEVRRLQSEREALQAKIKDMQEQLSVFNTPLGDIKRIIKGLELPLTLLPLALIFMGGGFIVFVLATRNRNVQLGKVSSVIREAATELAKAQVTASKQAANAQARRDSGLAERKEVARQETQIGEATDNRRLEAATEALRRLKDSPFAVRMLVKEWLSTGKSASLAGLIGLCDFETSEFLTAALSLEEQERLAQALQENQSSGGQVQAALALFHNLRAYEVIVPRSLLQSDWKIFLQLSEAGSMRVLSSLATETQAFLFNLSPTALAAKWYQNLPESNRDAILRASISINIHDENKIQAWTEEILSAAMSESKRVSGLSVTARGLKFLLAQHDPVAESLAAELARDPGNVAASEALEGFVSFEDALKFPKQFLADFFVNCEEADLAGLLVTSPNPISQFVVSLLPQQKAATVTSLARNLATQAHKKGEMKKRSSELRSELIATVQATFGEELREMQRQRQLQAAQQPEKKGA